MHFPSAEIGPFGRRQRHARGHRIPVTIVARTCVTPSDRDTAIITDVFGPHDLVWPGACRCCTVRGELQRALRRRLAEREQRHFNRVAIRSDEEPGPILRTFASERALGADFYVEDAQALASTPAEGLCRFVLTEDAPLPWHAFSRFITTLRALRGADLLHVEGRLNIAGCRGPVMVQFMQHLAHAPVELEAWPDDDRASRIAFVTRDIEETAVRSLLEAVRALGAHEPVRRAIFN